jgi:hypothetical protein
VQHQVKQISAHRFLFAFSTVDGIETEQAVYKDERNRMLEGEKRPSCFESPSVKNPNPVAALHQTGAEDPSS